MTALPSFDPFPDGRGPDGPPTLRVCGLDISVVGIAEAADRIADYCRSDARQRSPRPLFVTSVNGHMLSLCASEPAIARLLQQADEIHCDGQPLVLLSRVFGRTPLPERVATTDLFPAVAERASRLGLTFYFHGATPEVNAAALRAARRAYPGLRIVGASHGYVPLAEEASLVAEIARLRPDVLWVAMGAPLEQAFAVRNLDALAGVGIVKTSGGLLDFVSGRLRRAPDLLQRAGFEWLYRLWLEPRRLFWRYALTNPHALVLIVRSLLARGPEADPR